MTEKMIDGHLLIEVDSKTKPPISELKVTGGGIINFKIVGGTAAITIPVRGRFLDGCTFRPIGYGQNSDLAVQRLEHCVIEDGKTARFQLYEEPKDEMEVWYTIICQDDYGWYFAQGSSPPRMIIRPR
jgi:hypothetical protein